MPTGGLHRSLYRQIVDHIGKQIIQEDFKPGDVLPNEDSLCAQLGVSRTVIREATKVLVEKGMLRSRPRVGTVVLPRHEWNLLDEDILRWEYEAGPTRKFLQNLIDVRQTIEPAAAQLAALRASDEEIAHIQAAFQQIEQSVDDPEAYILADIAFHDAIFAACHNELLEQVARTITTALRASRKVTVQLPRSSEIALPLHESVMHAIEQHDAHGAYLAMQKIIDKAAADIDTVLLHHNGDLIFSVDG